jgi:hypothetical protein
MPQRGITDELLGPDLIAQLLFGDDLLAMRKQVGENLEHFTPQPDGLASALQHMALRVERTRAEDIDHT